MARIKSRKTAPVRPTYHLAQQLQALAIDNLYSFTAGRRTLPPVEGHPVTALLTAHPWGYSSQLCACTADGDLLAAAEASAAHPLPATIPSRITAFQSGPLTWRNAAGAISDDGPAPTAQVVFVAIGEHRYELRRNINPDTRREHWDLRVDGQSREHPFAGPVGAADFIIESYEFAR